MDNRIKPTFHREGNMNDQKVNERILILISKLGKSNENTTLYS